jgi:SAM-dependent methyltransferase
MSAVPSNTTGSGNEIAREVFSRLHCPSCGSRLESASPASTQPLVYDVLRCPCAEYPVVNGIPILRRVNGLSRVVDLVRESRPRDALLAALQAFTADPARGLGFHGLRQRWRISQVVSRDTVSLMEAAQKLRRNGAYADYLVHRYANPSFLAALGVHVALAHAARGRVLDLACGAGHAGYLMQLLGPALSMVSADSDFVNLYLARRYLGVRGVHVCLDAESPLPFPDEYFDAVHCLDAFHYLAAKHAVIRELKRVVQADGMWAFPHLHNARGDNPVPGLPLTPEAYMACFDLPGARLFAERDLLHGLQKHGALDLRTAPHPDALRTERALTLVRARSAVLESPKGVPAALCRAAQDLHVNPIFRVRTDEDGMRLERRWPSTAFAVECADAETILPAAWRLRRTQVVQLEAGWSGAPPDWVHDLVARFVLVPLPARYLPPGAGGPWSLQREA